MLTLRAKLLLFLIPIIIGVLVSILGISMMIESQWKTLSHPEYLIAGAFTVFSSMILWMVWFVLHNVTASLEYVQWSMRTASFGRTTEERSPPPSHFSDTFEISEILEATQQMKIDLAKKQEELLENTKLAEMGHSMAKVVHDIGAPMWCLDTIPERLKKHWKNNDSEKMLETIETMGTVTKQVYELYQELLRQYRGEPLKIESFSVAELLDGVCTSLQNTVLGQSSTWERHDSIELLPAKGSRNLLHRAISNIVKNALEALYDLGYKIPQSDKKLTITSYTIDHNYYEIHIHDNVGGISTATQEAILKGGFSEGKETGHGLGMQVARQAMDFHGGRIHLHSSKEKGTTFVLRLPFSGVPLETKEHNDNALVFNAILESLKKESNELIEIKTISAFSAANQATEKSNVLH